MAAVSAVLEPLPVGARVVGPRGRLHRACACCSPSAPRPAGSSSRRSTSPTPTATLRARATAPRCCGSRRRPTRSIGVAELDRLVEGAHAAGAEVAVDATFATPLLQRPLELGADIVVHSATKFIGGHSDLLLGVAIARDPERADALRHTRATLGAHAGRARGVPRAARPAHPGRAARARARRSAAILAERLAAHPAVSASTTPACPTTPATSARRALMDGFGAMLAFEVDGGADAAEAVAERVRVIVHATSLGGVESLIERRARYAAEAACPPALLRLSVGIEHVEDLWADLERALNGCNEEGFGVPRRSSGTVFVPIAVASRPGRPSGTD